MAQLCNPLTLQPEQSRRTEFELHYLRIVRTVSQFRTQVELVRNPVGPHHLSAMKRGRSRARLALTLRYATFLQMATRSMLVGKNLDSIISNLEKDMKIAIYWYPENEMVANPEKFQLMLLGLKDDLGFSIDRSGNVDEITDSVILLGITIDSKLNFNLHVQSICKKTSNKVRTFSRIAPNLEYEKSTIVYIIIIIHLFIVGW